MAKRAQDIAERGGRKDRSMGVLMETAMAGLSGAAAVALIVGFGGVGVGSTGGASTTAPPPTSMTSVQQHSTAPAVHLATLTGCVTGANC